MTEFIETTKSNPKTQKDRKSTVEQISNLSYRTNYRIGRNSLARKN